MYSWIIIVCLVAAAGLVWLRTRVKAEEEPPEPPEPPTPPVGPFIPSLIPSPIPSPEPLEPPGPQEGLYIHGSIKDEATKAGLQGALIEVDGHSGVTDYQGNYGIFLPAGSYSATASIGGYLPKTMPVPGSSGGRLWVSFSLQRSEELLPTPPSPTPLPQGTCPHCGATFPTPTDLADHIKSKHKKGLFSSKKRPV